MPLIRGINCTILQNIPLLCESESTTVKPKQNNETPNKHNPQPINQMGESCTAVAIDAFLASLRHKIEIFGITYEDREKNQQAMADLEILPVDRRQIIRSLNVNNYCSGPTKDQNDGSRPDYYVFGTTFRGVPIYVKLNLGRPNKSVHCISFHRAAGPFDFPLKKN